MEDEEKKEKKSVSKKNVKTKSETGARATPIEINPEYSSIRIQEADDKLAVFTFGRMNPPTAGHEKLVKKIESIAKQSGGMPHIYLSHSSDKRKNPLTYADKIRLATRAFGKMVTKTRARNVIDVMKELETMGHKAVTMVVGSDRVREFDTLLKKYNGKDYNFDSINVVSAGERDPDAEGVEGMSASKMRDAASKDDVKAFKSGLPAKLKTMASSIMDMVRAGLELQEELDALNEERKPLTIQQRRKRGLIMRRYKSKIKRGREIARRRMATSSRLATRAQRKAKQMVRKRVASKRGENYRNLAPGDKIAVDRLVAKKTDLIKKIAKRLLPKEKKAELERLKKSRSFKKEDIDLNFEFMILNELQFTSPKTLPNLKIPKTKSRFEKQKSLYQPDKKKTRGKFRDEDIDEAFENILEVRQDPDIKDKKGTQPAKYHKGLAPSTKSARDAQFKRQAKMDDDDPKAYKPAPGDATAKTKPSKYTTMYHKMYNEDFEAAIKDVDINLKHRNETIEKNGYGPANPDVPGNFWKEKADLWKVSEDIAKTMKCSNCAAFDQSPSTIKKMSDAIGPDGDKVVKLGNLGFCEFFEFKCAGSRTCDAWVHGGPITEQETAIDTTKDRHKQEKERLKVKHDREMDRARLSTARAKNREVTESNLIESVDYILDDLLIQEAYILTEKSANALADKAKKSGISVGTLRKVYNRGVAAWKTGHRPGTTPQQWGYARVNAFIAKKKKGNLNHDKDLAHYEPEGKMIESLWDNIHKKRERIKRGSGEKMRKVGDKGAPTPDQIKRANENFMDGKGPGKKGDMARHGLKDKSISQLKKIRSSDTASPRKKQLAHWYINMHSESYTPLEMAIMEGGHVLEESPQIINEAFDSMFGGIWAKPAPTVTEIDDDPWRRQGLYKHHYSIEEDAVVEELQEKGKCGCNPETIEEADVDGKKVKLNDPIRTSEVSSKKFKVYVKDPSTGNIKVVRFGDPNLSIKRDNPDRRRSFRARHNCDNPGPKTKARYWSCYQWRAGSKVDN